MASDSFLKLSDFILNRMQMQHVYQPVMIKTLVENDGEASIRQIAQAFLAKDQSQIEYYEEITKRMPGLVLSRRGIVERSGQSYRLACNPDELSVDEKRKIVELCEQRLEQYINRKGSDGFDHRRAAKGYISGSTRYEVLKNAGFRCELCGISASKRAIEVDHIVPRSLGGKDILENFQALCYICNAAKGNRDVTDFRGIDSKYAYRADGCALCKHDDGLKIAAENSLAFAVWRNHGIGTRPASQSDESIRASSHMQEGAALFLHSVGASERNHLAFVAPKRHATAYFDLFEPERRAIHMLLEHLQASIRESDRSITSFSIRTDTHAKNDPSLSHMHTEIQAIRIR